MKALVVGGAGATGTVIVKELLKRDYDVTILSRGIHSSHGNEKNITRLQADPHELEPVQQALDGKQFDLAIVTYGRLRHVAEALIGKTRRIISVGGAAPIYKGWGQMTSINPWETTEHTPLFLDEDHPLSKAEGIDRFAGLVRKTEDSMMQFHNDGTFNVTHFRYPLVYGPNNICPAEWGIVRRYLNKRDKLILPGGGLTIVSRGFADNVAHGIMLAVDKPDAAAGQIYNICDDQLIYNHEWVSLVCDILNFDLELIDVPFSWLPEGFRATPPQLLYRNHGVMSLEKIKNQLGYHDIVSPQEGIERTVKWYLDNPIDHGGEAELNLGDPFDYEYEDAFIAAYKDQTATFKQIEKQLDRKPVVWKHPYQ